MSVCFRKEGHGEICEGLHFPKLSAVGDRLHVTVFFGYMPKTSSSGERFILFLTFELNAK